MSSRIPWYARAIALAVSTSAWARGQPAPSTAPTTPAAPTARAAPTERAEQPAPPSPPAAETAPPAPEAGPAPAASTPAAPPPAAAPGPPSPIVLTLPPPPTDALLHIASNYDGTVLEGRVRVDGGDYRPLCTAPCDRPVKVDGIELRVTAPGMTTSNVFAVDPGPGVARFRVHGGSAALRTTGLVAFIAGLPVAFTGMTFYALSKVNDDPGQRTTGIATLAVGAVITAVAIPLLILGGTSVSDGRNKDIARAAPPRGPLF